MADDDNTNDDAEKWDAAAAVDVAKEKGLSLSDARALHVLAKTKGEALRLADNFKDRVDPSALAEDILGR